MNIEKKASTKLGTARVAQTFQWRPAGLNIILSKECLFILKFGQSVGQQGQTLLKRVIPRYIASLLFFCSFGWGHCLILFTDLFWSVSRFSLNFRK